MLLVQFITKQNFWNVTMLPIILEPSLSFIYHILKASGRLRTVRCSMYWRHFIETIWYKILLNFKINEIPLLRWFTNAFLLDGLSIILELNWFYINNYFYHHIKWTIMGIFFAVVGSNLMGAYFPEKMFAILSQIYLSDFVVFLFVTIL